MDDQLVGPVAKVYVPELHIPSHLLGADGACGFRHLLLFIQEFKYTFRCRCRGLEGIGNIGDLGDGLGEGAHVLYKGLDVANIDHLLDREISP